MRPPMRANQLVGNDGPSTDLFDVENPGLNDVLFGRGTGSNMHSGNIRFRALIQSYKKIYRDTPKKMKPSVSTKVVALWRAQDPPGRFLTRSDRYHGSKRSYYDVGDAAARRKAAQCLREKCTKDSDEQPAFPVAVTMEDNDESKVAAAEVQEPVFSFADEGNKMMTIPSLPGMSESGELLSDCSSIQGEDEDGLESFDLGSLPTLKSAVSGNCSMLLKSWASKDTINPNSEPHHGPISNDSDQYIHTRRLAPDTQRNASAQSNNLFPSAMFPSLFKDVLKPSSQQKSSWPELPKSAGANMSSLTDVFGSNHLTFEEEGSAEFSLSGFNFGDDAMDNNNDSQEDSGNDGGGLCFPSLFGESTSSTANLSPTPALSFAHDTSSQQLPLENIRNSIPTAASLTLDLFD